MIPDMGYHFLNPKVSGFSIRKPPILVYEHHGRTWQLGALEWVFTSMPAKPPVLAYGRTWRGGVFTCLSQAIGLRCSNRVGHGFFLSRERWYRF